MYSIKAIAEKTGKTSRALRYYEQLGILVPDMRTDAGYRMYSEKAVFQIEWIDKLNRLGFSLPEIKNFLLSFESIESASDLMAEMGALYQEKLLEVQQQIAQLQQLATELQESIQFTNQCKPCHLSVNQSACSSCTLHGHEPTRIPILVAGVQESLQHSHD
jgi:DNA-binding transcriptional MerR regulator